MKYLTPAAVLASLLLGCGGAAPARAPAAEAAPAPAPEERPGPREAAGARDGEPATEDPHHVKVIELTPSEERELSQRVPPTVRNRLEQCHPVHDGGKLRVRVVRDQGRVHFQAEPGSSLNPTEKKCALEALTELRKGDVASTLWSGATVPATGFTSLLTIEW
jgi:hypothetical protein